MAMSRSHFEIKVGQCVQTFISSSGADKIFVYPHETQYGSQMGPKPRETSVKLPALDPSGNPTLVTLKRYICEGKMTEQYSMRSVRNVN